MSLVMLVITEQVRSAFSLPLCGKFVATRQVQTATTMSKSRVIVPVLLQAKTFAEEATG